MSVTSKTKLIAKLRDKEYRDAYVEEKVSTSLPFQIRALREQPDRQWSQAELGKRAGMRQNAISRLEDAESGTPSISTLLRLAHAFDVALLIKFVPFRKLLSEFADLSTEALQVKSFDDEVSALTEAAAAITSYSVSVPIDTTTPIHEGTDQFTPWTPLNLNVNLDEVLQKLANMQIASAEDTICTTDLVSVSEIDQRATPSPSAFLSKSTAISLATEMIQ